MAPRRLRRWYAPSVAVALTAGLAGPAAGHASAQTPRLPELGGRTVSLGQPPRWRWEAGLAAGMYFEGPPSDPMIRAFGGVYHPALNPVAGLAEIGMEGYVGVRGRKLDGGLRTVLAVPFLSGGGGADYSLRRGRLDMLVTLHSPVRRGGVLTRGTLLRLDWYPLLTHSFTLGVSAPLGDRLAGRSRPTRDHVVVSGDLPVPAPHRSTRPALDSALDSLGTSAEWLRRLIAPFLDQDGRDARIALTRTARYVATLRTHLAFRSVDDEIHYYHAQLERVFTLASGDSTAGRTLAQHCREILLDEVLLPYDGLLGRKKRNDTLRDLGVAARGRFSRSVAATGLLTPSRGEDVMYAFQQVVGILEAARRRAVQEWDDPRLVWLPLQYALLPEDYDDQAELDRLLERATSAAFADHNRLSYVANLGFHQELLHMIRETRDYHVLWIHDFPAVTETGKLDWASFTQVVDGYLATLAQRVETYDSTGTLPSFFLFLDQHYYEERKSQILMRLLEDPLRASPGVPLGTAEDVARLTSVLTRLKTAVQESRVLQSEAREYGDAWLRNRIKVHVSITNRPDASFWSGGLISTVFGYPDNVMRDHRKLAFRDVREGDPFAGIGILTGMGVGQQYLGPGWDDRSLILQGPVLLGLRRAARNLLLSQGLTLADLPTPLREGLPFEEIPTRLAAAPDATRFDARAMVLVNGTGYLPKPINVAKALLYSLLPAGAVIKAPDSLWNSTFFAGLLVGASLRGAHVLVIAPAGPNAPSNGFPQMVRAHELLTVLLLVRRDLGDAIAAASGDLRTGLYALPADRQGFASRADLWARQVAATPFLQTLLPFAHELVPVVADAARPDTAVVGPIPEPADSARHPKLHQKVQFLATRELWTAIVASPEWPRFMTDYLRYRAATYAPGDQYVNGRVLPDTLELIAERVFSEVHDARRAASYALVGSQNQDYRGMFMDGEIGVLFTGPESLLPLLDLVFMAGTATWVDDQATLDRLLPPGSALQRRIARVAKEGV